jgi:hypothetical protein
MKRALLIGLVFTLGMILQGFQDHRTEHKRGINVAVNSFETGCLIQGRDACIDRYPTDDTIILRSDCLETTLTQCADKTRAYGEWFSTGTK